MGNGGKTASEAIVKGQQKMSIAAATKSPQVEEDEDLKSHSESDNIKKPENSILGEAVSMGSAFSTSQKFDEAYKKLVNLSYAFPDASTIPISKLAVIFSHAGNAYSDFENEFRKNRAIFEADKISCQLFHNQFRDIVDLLSAWRDAHSDKKKVVDEKVKILKTYLEQIELQTKI